MFMMKIGRNIFLLNQEGRDENSNTPLCLLQALLTGKFALLLQRQEVGYTTSIASPFSFSLFLFSFSLFFFFFFLFCFVFVFYHFIYFLIIK